MNRIQPSFECSPPAARSSCPEPPTQSSVAMRTMFAAEGEGHPERDQEEGAPDKAKPLPGERDPRGLEQDHQPEPVRARADRCDDDGEVADLDEVGLGSHRHVRRAQPQQDRGTSQRRVRQDAPEILGAGGGSPGERADRDREERIRPAWKSTAANHEGGAEIQSAMTPVTTADASTSATAALDGDGAPGRKTARARRAVTPNATGWSAAAGQGLHAGSGPRSARSDVPRLSIHPAATEPRTTGIASRTACTKRIAGPEVGRSTRNERIRYSTRSRAAGIPQRSAERAWCCASGSRQPGSSSVSASGVAPDQAGEERGLRSVPATPGEQDAATRHDCGDRTGRGDVELGGVLRRLAALVGESRRSAQHDNQCSQTCQDVTKHRRSSPRSAAPVRSSGATLLEEDVGVNHPFGKSAWVRRAPPGPTGAPSRMADAVRSWCALNARPGERGTPRPFRARGRCPGS